MKTEKYIYSLLQYRHSQILGEVLNIGLLVYFKNKRQLRFIFPEKLIRLKFAYPNVPDKTIKAYYRSFENRINQLNNEPELYSQYELESTLDRLINQELLASDSSALQFSETKTAISYSEDIEQISNQLYNLYFTVFEHDINNSKRVDEITLIKEYKKLLFELDENNNLKDNKSFKWEYEIHPTDSKGFKFDFAWHDDNNVNLVKPISFDVVRDETIRNKAYRFYGQFVDLDDFAIKNNYKFDLLLAKPKNRNLFKSYDVALKLLEKPKSVLLIEESELKEYSIKTLNAISSSHLIINN